MVFCSPEVHKNPVFDNAKSYTKKISLSKYKYSKTVPTDLKIKKKETKT